MVELIAYWIFLFVGIITGNPQWCIASGAFAVAVQISRIADKKK